MKKAVYWLMGDRGGEATVTAWNWLWGMNPDAEESPESDADAGMDEIATAEASFKTMQQSVQQLAAATNRQYAAYQQARQLYIRKVRDLGRAESSVINAKKEGRSADAEAAVIQTVQISQLLPKLEAQVEQAEAFVNESQAKLRRERDRLESYKSDLQTLKNLTEINDALAAIAQTHNEQDMASARAQFEKVKDSVHTRYLEKQAYAELSADSADVLDSIAQQYKIAQRLQQLNELPPTEEA
ncbi:MAG: PspA/IM30 family protein [Cyanobacteria bacterium P01_A01_bin.15]